jgi:hypothetical protein
MYDRLIGVPSFTRRQLAACIAAIFAWSASTSWCNTLPVTNCGDAGSGSLRDAVATAVSGDTIDLSGLTVASPGCANSTISLTTGAIVVAQDSLTISGPGMNNLTVSGKYGFSKETARIFTHTGNGTLAIQALSVSEGYLTTTTGGNLFGACIYSKANASLTNVGVYLCSGFDQSPSGGTKYYTQGGGVFTVGSLTLTQSVISHNSVTSQNHVARGGGVMAYGSLTVIDSVIDHNYALGTASNVTGFGGGAVSFDGADVEGSTLSNNYGWIGAGAGQLLGSKTGTVTINNSTISGNRTGNVSGAASAKYSSINLVAHAGTVHVNNSTIAFNTTTGGSANGTAGLLVSFPPYTVGPKADLESTLIASNTAGVGPYDFQTESGMTILGANNLILTPGVNATIPPATLVGLCPLLHPLAANGGPTRTHRLERHSPGTDTGNNSQGFAHDQRGAPFPRNSGGTPDIGAYEIDQSDIVFDSQFEGCL